MISSAFHVDGVSIETTQHNRALECGNEDRCNLVRVRCGAHLPALYAFVYNAVDGGAPIVHRGLRAVSQHLVSIIRLNGSIQNRAAASNRRVIGDALKNGD